MNASERCDCGHSIRDHNRLPDGKRGRCLFCRCEGVTQRTKWADDDREPEAGGDE